MIIPPCINLINTTISLYDDILIWNNGNSYLNGIMIFGLFLCHELQFLLAS
jgi:hypothetical protein